MNLPNSRTRIDEIADDLFRISTTVDIMPGGFTFNQFLIRDERPLLFHTGGKSLFEAVRAAVATVIEPKRLRYISYSHVEADECGSLNEWLATAREAEPVCSALSAGIALADSSLRPAKGLADGERLSLGRHVVRWCDAPHVPHGWDSGFMFEETTRTLLCGDLFTQPGGDHVPVTDNDIFEPSEVLRKALSYYAPGGSARGTIERLAANEPRLLACMHGASYAGDGASLLRTLAAAVAA